MNIHTPIYKILAYCGAIPFIVFALLHLADIQQIKHLGTTTQLTISYGLLIVSFMCGIHWGIQLQRSIKTNLFIISNVLTLSCWFIYLMGPVFIIIITYILCFSALLYIDHQLKSSSMISGEYFKMRTIVTSIVIISLLVQLL